MMGSRKRMADEAREITTDDVEVKYYDEDDETVRYKVRDKYGTEGYFDVDEDGKAKAGRVTRPSRHTLWLQTARRAVTSEHRRREREEQGYAYCITWPDGEQTLDFHDEQVHPELHEAEGIEVTIISWK